MCIRFISKIGVSIPLTISYVLLTHLLINTGLLKICVIAHYLHYMDYMNDVLQLNENMLCSVLSRYASKSVEMTKIGFVKRYCGYITPIKFFCYLTVDSLQCASIVHISIRKLYKNIGYVKQGTLEICVA